MEVIAAKQSRVSQSRLPKIYLYSAPFHSRVFAGVANWLPSAVGLPRRQQDVGREKFIKLKPQSQTLFEVNKLTEWMPKARRGVSPFSLSLSTCWGWGADNKLNGNKAMERRVRVANVILTNLNIRYRGGKERERKASQQDWVGGTFPSPHNFRLGNFSRSVLCPGKMRGEKNAKRK